MRTVSAGFTTEVTTQTKARESIAKIVFRQVDVDARTDATVTSTSTETVSDTAYTVDDIDFIDRNYATYETDRWQLGGGFKLLPSSAPYQSMGWWSGILSHATLKTFTHNITITCTFTGDHSSPGISINWDSTNGECAEEFDVKFYDSSNVLIETISETTNTDSQYSNDTAVSNYRKIEVIIKKWSVGDRRARIEEIIFGVITVYSKDNKLITCRISEEIDIVSATIPANQLEFTIDNLDNAFDILNPSGIYSYLQEQQRIDAYMGVMVSGAEEYVNMGRFYLDEWKTEDNQIGATFKALDRLNLLNQETYYKGLKQTITLYDLAEDVLQDFGLTSSEYNIDTALQSITMTNFLPVCTYREALQYIATAGECVFYVDRDNIIQIIQLSNTSTGVTLDFDNSYKAPSINLEKIIKQYDVDLNTYSTSGSTSDIYKGIVYINGTSTIWLTYDSPAENASASVDVGSIDAETYYTGACSLTITSTGDTAITITGNVISISKTPITTSGESTGGVVKVESPLITDSQRASSVGAWVKSELQKREIFESEWRTNPALELTDLADIENQFTTYTDSRILKQEFNYDGALKGKTTLRGGS